MLYFQRTILPLIVTFGLSGVSAQMPGHECSLDDAFVSKYFTVDQLQNANTAQDASYLSEKEKRVYQFLNLARLYPRDFALFYHAYLVEYEPQGLRQIKRRDRYYYTLKKELRTRQPVHALQPKKDLSVCAEKWRHESGQRGVIGHNRRRSKNIGNAESCAYSYQDSPLNFVMDLLIDTEVPSLGHRKILLGGYSEAGVAIGTHKGYGHCVVIDLR